MGKYGDYSKLPNPGGLNNYDEIEGQVELTPLFEPDPVLLTHTLQQVSDQWPRILMMAPEECRQLRLLLSQIWTLLDKARDMAQEAGK